MSIGARIGALERVEEGRYRAAVARFADFWRALLADPALAARAAAWLREAGGDGDTLARIAAWDARQPPEHRALYAAEDVAIGGMVAGAHDAAAIRAALAALAPALGLRADAAPSLIIDALQTAIARDSG